MKVFRKIGLFALAIVSILTISSCGNSIYTMNPTYKNSVKKGKKVDSITLECERPNKQKTEVTITKNDTYFQVIDKLNTYGELSLQPNILYNDQTFSRDLYISNTEDTNYKRESNTSFFGSFFIGNTKINDNGKTNKWLNRGAYYKNSYSDFAYELATNYVDDKHIIEANVSDEEKKNFKDTSIYFKIEADNKTDFNEKMNSKYTYNNYSFSPNDFVYGTQTGRYFNKALLKDNYNFAPRFYNEAYFKKSIMDYYGFEGSVELTSNFIIFKHRINYYYIDQLTRYSDISSYTKNEKFMNNLRNTYYTEEIWLNYKGDKQFGSLKSGLINKYVAYCSYYKFYSKFQGDKVSDEYYYEKYDINLSQSKVDKKRNSFINKCKKNNVLDKYPFKMV